GLVGFEVGPAAGRHQEGMRFLLCSGGDYGPLAEALTFIAPIKTPQVSILHQISAADEILHQLNGRRGNNDGERGGWLFDSTEGAGGAGGTYSGGGGGSGSGTGTGGFGGGGGGGCGGSSNKCNGACSGQCKSSGGGGGGYSGGGSGVNEDQAGGGGGSYCSGAGCSSVTGGSVNSANPHGLVTATANCPSTSKKDTSVQVALPDNEKQQKSAGGGPEKFNRPRTAAEATTAAALPVAMDGLRIRWSPHPGSPSWLAKLNTGYNQRARQGFVYWFTGRPKPTQFGRYSTGAKHMQYGLGMAPRS
uniref:PE-PGRS family protein n=1 Tax=Macrostomum lignano TaxID=282301 RepID=A0A1I8ITW6_9PLAT